MKVPDHPIDHTFDDFLHSAKVTLTGLKEAQRTSLSPSRFVYFSNPRVTKIDRFSEEITLTLDKPIDPPELYIGSPGYYPVGDYKLGHEHMRKYQAKEAKRKEAERLQEVREFYKKKGIKDTRLLEELLLKGTEDDVNLQRWWLS